LTYKGARDHLGDIGTRRFQIMKGKLMRLYNLRSIIILSLALASSAFLFTAPASAVPIDYGAYTVHVDKAMHDFHAAVVRDEAQREAAIFLNSNPVPAIGGKGGQRAPFDLKPEYAESYATHGLTFIDLRLRC
jgi:hypothetical protein